MSIPVFPDVVPEIDANSVNFYGQMGAGKGVGHVWSLTRQFAKYGEWREFAAPAGHPKN